MECHLGGCLCYGPPVEDGFYYDTFLDDGKAITSDSFAPLEKICKEVPLSIFLFSFSLSLSLYLSPSFLHFSVCVSLVYFFSRARALSLSLSLSFCIFFFLALCHCLCHCLCVIVFCRARRDVRARSLATTNNTAATVIASAVSSPCAPHPRCIRIGYSVPGPSPWLENNLYLCKMPTCLPVALVRRVPTDGRDCQAVETDILGSLGEFLPRLYPC